ncbi:MAG: hypothetical protein ABWZ82_03205 [Candidatus Limnocylindrales bacterium]
MQHSRRVRGASLRWAVIGLSLTLASAALAPAALGQGPSPDVAPLETPALDGEPVTEPSALCSALTEAEVSSALGVELQVADSTDYDCSWYSDFVTSDLGLLVTRDAGDIELDGQGTFPEGVAVDVSGAPGWFAADVGVLFVDLGDGMLFTIELSGTPGEGLDVREALTGLATLAVPRLATIPVPTEVPVPTPEGDPVLEALIPTRLGDVELFIDVYSANDVLATLDPTNPDPTDNMADLASVIEPHGKTLDDVSFADAYFDTGQAIGGLLAVRVAGAEVADFQDALFDALIQIEDPHRRPGTIAGRQVTLVTEGPPVSESPDPSSEPGDPLVQTSYVYPAGDVLFIVGADEPQLTQLFEQLP